MQRHAASERIRKPTHTKDNLNEGVGVSPVLAAGAQEEKNEEETADIQDEDDAKGLEKQDATAESADDAGEVEPLKAAFSPCLPCAADVEEHRLTQNPYRS